MHGQLYTGVEEAASFRSVRYQIAKDNLAVGVPCPQTNFAICMFLDAILPCYIVRSYVAIEFYK